MVPTPIATHMPICNGSGPLSSSSLSSFAFGVGVSVPAIEEGTGEVEVEVGSTDGALVPMARERRSLTPV